MANPQFVVIEQRISAGNDWDGSAPSTVPSYATKGVKAFPEDDGGGLFEWEFSSFFLMEIQQINVSFGDAAEKSISIRRPSGPDVAIFSSSDPAEAIILITDKYQLASDEHIVIVSSGATEAMYARIIARPLHPEPASAV